MKLKLVKFKDDLKRTIDFIVIDEDNYSLPFSPINNFILSNKQLSSNTIEGYCNVLINYFMWLDRKDINYKTITEREIINYRDELINEPDQRYKIARVSKESNNITGFRLKEKKASTINDCITKIRCFYDFLVKRNEVIYNPCELKSVKKPSINNQGVLKHTKNNSMLINTLKVKESDMSYYNKIGEYESIFIDEELSNKAPFTEEEIKTIIGSLKNSQEVLAVCMMFLGMRVSDIIGRRPNDILWADKEIRIIKREDDPKDGHAKYESYRSIPIQGILYFDNLPEVMLAAYQDYVNTILRPKKSANRHNYLFITLNGAVKPLTYDNIYRRIIANNLKNKFTTRIVTLHSFRHHFATTSIAMGTPIEKVQKILGHRNLSTTIDRYYNPTLDLLADLVKRKSLDSNEAKDRIDYIVQYKKEFGSKFEPRGGRLNDTNK
ncbi:tyrosine-type recombinase/integrase [Clostridium paraputrificum]|uniref:tyrosine-type recombinase/integrase n=1 Tax=Clostridium paraputrificum TaxID=29363 RepID=UPI00325B4A29